MSSRNQYPGIALMACMIMSLSSCSLVWKVEDDMDVNQSIKFAGQWTGDFGMYYNYRHMGRIYTFNSYDTDIVFYPEFDGATYGWGKQVDYYEYGPYTHIYNRFDWEIRRGVIYLKYYSDYSLNCAIYDYIMTRDRFSGRFGDSSDKFYMFKIADYYDWSIYLDYYYFFQNGGWHWSPMLSGQTSMTTEETLPEPLTRSDTKNTTEGEGIVFYGKRF